MAHDPINPAHYAKIQGLALEPLIMEAPYFLGAAIKYVWRCKKKGGAEDIRKARRCLELHLEGVPAATPGALEAAARFIRKTQHNPHGLQVTVIVKLLDLGYQLNKGYKLPGLFEDLDTLEKALGRGGVLMLDLEERGYEYGGDIAARYPGFTASKWVTSYETETGARYRVIATRFTGDTVEMLCRTPYPRYRAAYGGFTPRVFVVRANRRNFT